MSEQPLLQAILPNWPVIGVVVVAFLLGKLGFSVLVLPLLLWFLYDSTSDTVFEAFEMVSTFALLTVPCTLEVKRCERSCFFELPRTANQPAVDPLIPLLTSSLLGFLSNSA